MKAARERLEAIRFDVAVTTDSINSYGWFLYRNARYAAAREMFIRAIEIDPQHPKARRNLEATERVIDRG